MATDGLQTCDPATWMEIADQMDAAASASGDVQYGFKAAERKIWGNCVVFPRKESRLIRASNANY